MDLFRSALLVISFSAQDVVLILSCHRPGTFRNFSLLGLVSFRSLREESISLRVIIN